MTDGKISAAEFAAKSFDYVIVGGGTAGLVMAARLSENPSVTVGVIEAGVDRSDDILVRIPLLHTELYEKPEYDWLFKTVPQGKNQKVHAWPRGKVLGGSSTINFSMLAKPSKTCLDSWAALGNPGWDWDGLLPYYRKFMTLNKPPAATEKMLDTSRMQRWVGDGNGPIQVSWPPVEYTSAMQHISADLGQNLGLRNSNADISESTGFYDQGLSVDMKLGRRSSAVYEYYEPNAHRKNLSLIMDAMVHRVVFSGDDAKGQKVATGVEFVVDGKKYTVSAKKEVILCAGTIQSPQILELSGIGSKSVLEKNGVKVLIDNPGVGENLQDHVMTGISYQAAPGVPTIEDLKRPGVIEALVGEYMQNPVGVLVNQMTSSIYLSYSDVLKDKSKLEQKVESLIPSSQTTGNTSLAKQMKIHKDRLLNPKDCAVWLIPFAGGADMSKVSHGAGLFNHDDPDNYLSVAVALTHPLSRGAIHIQSSDANDHPIMDPRYLSHPADIHVLADTVRFVNEKIVRTEPLLSKLKSDGSGLSIQPSISSFTPDTAEDFVQNFLSTQWHVLGTCSMLPRAEGGVVDPTLKVYGTANLRVVDASVIPLEVQGNIQTAVYAVAEKGADLVKATW